MSTPSQNSTLDTTGTRRPDRSDDLRGAVIKTKVGDAVGPSGPTPQDIAARGRPRRRAVDSEPRATRGDWRTRR